MFKRYGIHIVLKCAGDWCKPCGVPACKAIMIEKQLQSWSHSILMWFKALKSSQRPLNGMINHFTDTQKGATYEPFSKSAAGSKIFWANNPKWTLWIFFDPKPWPSYIFPPDLSFTTIMWACKHFIMSVTYSIHYWLNIKGILIALAFLSSGKSEHAFHSQLFEQYIRIKTRHRVLL